MEHWMQPIGSKAKQLVYVHSNLRLLTYKQNQYKEEGTKLWNVDPEQTDLDFSQRASSCASDTAAATNLDFLDDPYDIDY